MPYSSTSSQYSFSGVRALLAEPRTKIRKDLVKSLGDFGLTNVDATGNLNEVHKRLAEGGLDLLICDTILPEGDLKSLLKSVRFAETTSNPFMVVIALVSNPTADVLQNMMECGPDAILVKPFTPEQLNERIQSLIHNRKRFAVTSEYIGPERRKGHREDKHGYETIRVPNPLYNKTFGVEDVAAIKRTSDTAISRINNQLVECHALKITELVTMLFSGGAKTAWNTRQLDRLNELREVAFEMNRRISMTDYRSLNGLTMTLNRMLKNAHNWDREKDFGDFNLLDKLCEILSRGFGNSEITPPASTLEDPQNSNQKKNSKIKSENVLECSSSG